MDKDLFILIQLSSKVTIAKAPLNISLIWEPIPWSHVSLSGNHGGGSTETVSWPNSGKLMVYCVVLTIQKTLTLYI